MAKNVKNIYDFRASDGLDPIVMQKLNTNFWNLMEMFEDPEIVAVSSILPPSPRTNETLWYKPDTGALYIWAVDDNDEWGWVDETSNVINSEEARQLITQIAMQAGGDKNYVHRQLTPATVWTINHQLNKHPSVTVIGDDGVEIQPYIEYGISDQYENDYVILYFFKDGTAYAESGWAYLN